MLYPARSFWFFFPANLCLLNVTVDRVQVLKTHFSLQNRSYPNSDILVAIKCPKIPYSDLEQTARFA